MKNMLQRQAITWTTSNSISFHALWIWWQQWIESYPDSKRIAAKKPMCTKKTIQNIGEDWIVLCAAEKSNQEAKAAWKWNAKCHQHCHMRKQTRKHSEHVGWETINSAKRCLPTYLLRYYTFCLDIFPDGLVAAHHTPSFHHSSSTWHLPFPFPNKYLMLLVKVVTARLWFE